MDPQIAELNQKIDALTAQVAYLAGQAQLAERSRLEREELFTDLLPVAHEAMQLATRELEDVKDYLDLQELVNLLKKVLRQRNQLEMLLDTLDSVMDMLDTSKPVINEAFDMATGVLEELDQKGYFGLARGGMRMAETVATSLNEEDLNRLGAGLVPLLNLVKYMSQPEVVTLLSATTAEIGQEVTKPVDSSLFSIMRQLQDPSVRRGLALTLRLLRVVGSKAVSNK